MTCVVSEMIMDTIVSPTERIVDDSTITGKISFWLGFLDGMRVIQQEKYWRWVYALAAG